MRGSLRLGKKLGEALRCPIPPSRAVMDEVEIALFEELGDAGAGPVWKV